MDKPVDVDAYISVFPEAIRKLLQEVRAAIKKAAPQAEEVISYGMPGYRQNGMLVWFAAFQNHIGFYPVPSGLEAFKEELSVYKGTKGSVHFPLDKPIPVDLIAKIVTFRLSENMQKQIAKMK